jgi:hypothetical protein
MRHCPGAFPGSRAPERRCREALGTRSRFYAYMYTRICASICLCPCTIESCRSRAYTHTYTHTHTHAHTHTCTFLCERKLAPALRGGLLACWLSPSLPLSLSCVCACAPVKVTVGMVGSPSFRLCGQHEISRLSRGLLMRLSAPPVCSCVSPSK